MIYKNKYYTNIKGTKKKGDGQPGRYPTPEVWISGDDPIEHDKYYAYLKHRAQALYRKEQYDLSWEDWRQLWPLDQWLKRGRHKDQLTMYRLDKDQPWHPQNVVICTQQEKGQYYDPNRNYGGRPKKS